jgi:8-oxo-dGTP diphosphatase
MVRSDHGMSAEEIAAWQARWGRGPFVTTDVVIVTRRPPGLLAVLLIERGIPPFRGSFAVPGGFVAGDEPLEAAARRELAEETGLEDLGDVRLEQLATFGDPGRDPRGRTVTIVYLAVVPWERVAHARGGDDAAAARFFEIRDGRPVDEEGRPLRLAFDHDQVLRAAIERLSSRADVRDA